MNIVSIVKKVCTYIKIKSLSHKSAPLPDQCPIMFLRAFPSERRERERIIRTGNLEISVSLWETERHMRRAARWTYFMYLST